jgi:uncharacterized Zn ribbon protein
MASVDFEAVRHRVKLLKDTGDTRVFENRDDVECPVCGEPFAEALASQRETEQLSPRDGLSLCLLNEADRVVLFTHAGDS